MRLSISQLKLLLALAVEAAEQAGACIVGFARRRLQVGHKSAGDSLSSQVVTQVDLDSQARILEVLQPTLAQYDLALLSEENASESNAASHPRLHQPYFWCIDPLDGTLPFIEAAAAPDKRNQPASGASGYAVAIALVDRTGWPWLGVVHDPATGETFQALNPCAPEDRAHRQVLRHGQPWSPTALEAGDPFRVYVDRSFLRDPRYPACLAILEDVAAQMGRRLEVIHNRGAVMNALGVITAGAGCYLKLPKAGKGGGSVWDFSATAAIAQACGTVWVSDIAGQPLDLNRPDSNFMNHRGVLYFNPSDPALMAALIARLAPLCI
ncbi:3'(2'),5'-bisphosphate nucleotidase CysQ [Photobacterium sp. TY1-4]|uniref:3'(2'),5'-bisphosphate nucleotidase CysQ family protein n=1 Tax=Photobacterium sp. TY1-4 TaxID=2899122 RepID=UPI0021C01985|nr:inositol monophosphatase family protein [Photobacterium sp. TY1-4]UXI03244.1 inositol-1-monophosphatase [Photobacterium sp. TY1-4]